MSGMTSRREFLDTAIGVGTVLATRGALASTQRINNVADKRRIRVGVIGCGSVSGSYLPHLMKCPYAQVVSLCDRRFERATARAGEFGVDATYPSIEKMLDGVGFDLLVNLTDMQEHEHINELAIAAGKHVWSEKPIANSLAVGQDLLKRARKADLRLWGAPTVVESPQFELMAREVQKGTLGRIAAAHAHYGHEGPNWSAFFYEPLGGSLPDLGVYNLTSVTGLLGPALSVTAVTSIVTPKRQIAGVGEIDVGEEDNAMILLEHAGGAISHVQSGFNYFNPHGHDGSHERRCTIEIVGSEGYMGMVGYDWAPQGVDLATLSEPKLSRYATDAGDYMWPMGASLACEHLVTGRPLKLSPEHALHVVEIIMAARKSQATRARVDLTSSFNWPLVSAEG